MKNHRNSYITLKIEIVFELERIDHLTISIEHISYNIKSFSNVMIFDLIRYVTMFF